MSELFPRTTVGGISLSRMLIGTNWILGWSHTSPSADAQIKETHKTPDTIEPMLEVALDQGVDSIMGLFNTNPALNQAIANVEQRRGQKIHIIDTPIPNMDDTAEARREAYETFKRTKSYGAEICLIHHTAAEQLVNKNRRTMDRLPDYLYMIRELGMVPGLSAHMPELIQYSDANEYDVETYVQIFNCMGFLMQMEIETVGRIIHTAKKPVMTIKPMAAGRCTPYVGLTFSFNAVRDIDMVTVGTLNARELAEDIEIARAALEHRYPGIGARSSPNPEVATLVK